MIVLFNLNNRDRGGLKALLLGFVCKAQLALGIHERILIIFADKIKELDIDI